MRHIKTLAGVFALAFILGCASTQTNAGKTLATVASTVDGTMHAWATYVVVTKTVTPEQEAVVRNLYVQYQSAMIVAQAAYLALASGDATAWNAASANLTAKAAALTAQVALTKKGTP